MSSAVWWLVVGGWQDIRGREIGGSCGFKETAAQRRDGERECVEVDWEEEDETRGEEMR